MKRTLLMLPLLFVSCLAQAVNYSQTLMPGDTMTVIAQSPSQVTVIIKDNPPPSGIQPTGTELVWKPNGNSRTYATNTGMTETRQFWFKTPSTPGEKRQLVATAAGGSQYEVKFWSLKDTENMTIREVTTQTFFVSMVIGSNAGMGWTFLKPNTYYVLRVTNMCNRLPCDYYIDLNNAS